MPIKPAIPKAPIITIAPDPPGGAPSNSSAPGAIRSLSPAATSIKPLAEVSEASPGATPGRRTRVRAFVALALVAGAAAVGVGLHPWSAAHPHTRRVSGTPEPRLTSSGAQEHWPVGAPIGAVLDPSIDAMDPGAKEAIIAAFATWQSANVGAPPVALTIDNTPGVAAEDGVNRILYGPITVPGYEKAVAVTISYADGDGVIVEADMIVNDAYKLAVVAKPSDETVPASAACGGRYDVQNVTTHEAGHFLGLGEDMTEEKATMFITSTPCQTHKRALTPGDVTAMQSIYAGVVPSASVAGGCNSH
jgi:hypothetical protein